MPYKSASFNSISSLVMIAGSKIVYISSKHYTTWIILIGIQSLLAHLPLQAHLNFELVRLAPSENRQINSEINRRYWGCDTQDLLPAWVTIVPGICASDKTHLTNSSGDQYAWLLYLTIGNIQKDICSTPKMGAWILVGLIPRPPEGVIITDNVWHSAVGTMVSPLRNLDRTGPGLKSNFADGF